MKHFPFLAAFVILSACVQPEDAMPDDCNCVEILSPEQHLDTYGITEAALVMTKGVKNEDGTYTEAIQFLTAEVTPAQLADAATKLCAADNATLLSQRITQPNSDFIDDPLSKVLIAECSAPPMGETE